MDTKITLFPMRVTDTGNLVCQLFDDTTLNGTKLVFVDALRASHFGLAEKVTKTWVECKETDGLQYPEFCSKHAVTLEGVLPVAYMDRETGEPWTTEKGEQWYGLVRNNA
jgi:hypothetical protein